MEKLIYYFNNYKRFIFVALSVVIVIIVCLLFFNNKKKIEENEIEILYKEENIDSISETIKVEVKGAIVNPGVYELSNNSRIEDAIKVAGGLNKNADTSIINLSKKLNDENVIIIYTKDEVKKIKEGNKVIQYIEKECNCPVYQNDACIDPDTLANMDSDTSSSSANKISINNADLNELQKLTGIGKTKAQAIIDYRNKNGFFKTIEELKKVSGIGSATFEKIKDDITI